MLAYYAAAVLAHLDVPQRSYLCRTLVQRPYRTESRCEESEDGPLMTRPPSGRHAMNYMRAEQQKLTAKAGRLTTCSATISTTPLLARIASCSSRHDADPRRAQQDASIGKTPITQAAASESVAQTLTYRCQAASRQPIYSGGARGSKRYDKNHYNLSSAQVTCRIVCRTVCSRHAKQARCGGVPVTHGFVLSARHGHGLRTGTVTKLHGVCKVKSAFSQHTQTSIPFYEQTRAAALTEVRSQGPAALAPGMGAIFSSVSSSKWSDGGVVQQQPHPPPQTPLLALVAVVKEVVANAYVHQIEGVRIPCVRDADIAAVTRALEAITAEDLGLKPMGHMMVVPRTLHSSTDIRYLHVTEREDQYSIGIFLLPPGAEMPLHDHPYMHVLSQLLYGGMTLTAMDWVGDPAERRAKVTQHLEIEAPYSMKLTPEQYNLHEMRAGPEGCAFLDVLVPPYKEDTSSRDCTYYEIAEGEAEREAADGGSSCGGGGGSGGGSGGSGGEDSSVLLIPCDPPQSFHVIHGTLGAGLQIQ
ncbi:hypothetical protein JKP88DRAFT_265458 [Tribonema minus]|uniref:2-aminoethanethiol dioxygenase n=1 Tax=Tribonema minus TaxID=303371 RepID=A0A835YIT4_9STRA|nr:hypothetical protein JKP88DRAFT_265458 [Tribonema minus]